MNSIKCLSFYSMDQMLRSYGCNEGKMKTGRMPMDVPVSAKYCQTGMNIFVHGGTDRSNRHTSWSSAEIPVRMKAWLLLCCLFLLGFHLYLG